MPGRSWYVDQHNVPVTGEPLHAQDAKRFPDEDPLQLAHLEGEELEYRLARLSCLAFTSAHGPETAVRVDSGCHPSPHCSDDTSSSVSSERGAHSA